MAFDAQQDVLHVIRAESGNHLRVHEKQIAGCDLGPKQAKGEHQEVSRHSWHCCCQVIVDALTQSMTLAQPVDGSQIHPSFPLLYKVTRRLVSDIYAKKTVFYDTQSTDAPADPHRHCS